MEKLLSTALLLPTMLILSSCEDSIDGWLEHYDYERAQIRANTKGDLSELEPKLPEHTLEYKRNCILGAGHVNC